HLRQVIHPSRAGPDRASRGNVRTRSTSVATAHTTEAGSSRAVRRPGDVVFSGLSSGAAFLIIVALAGVAIFLTIEGWPAVTASSGELGADNIVLHVWPLLFGTLLAAAIAMLIATPLAIGLALVISHYAPRRLAG